MTYRFGVAAVILWAGSLLGLAWMMARVNLFGFASRDLRMVVPFALAWLAFHGGRLVLPHTIGHLYLRWAVARELRSQMTASREIRSQSDAKHS